MGGGKEGDKEADRQMVNRQVDRWKIGDGKKGSILCVVGTVTGESTYKRKGNPLFPTEKMIKSKTKKLKKIVKNMLFRDV